MATARAVTASMRLTCALSTLAILAAILFMFLLLLAGALQLRVPTGYAVVDCAPPPPSDDSAAAFLDSLLPLLAALPAAAAPTGFAALHSDGAAFARVSKHLGLEGGLPSSKEMTTGKTSSPKATTPRKTSSCGEETLPSA